MENNENKRFFSLSLYPSTPAFTPFAHRRIHSYLNRRVMDYYGNTSFFLGEKYRDIDNTINNKWHSD